MRFCPSIAVAAVVFSMTHARADELDEWCKSVKLSSSIVICGDPELLALAIERQHAFDAAQSRLSPDQQKELLADQNGWVKSYAAACGVPQGAPPPNPVPDSVKACFRRAGEARITYLRAYRGSEWPAVSATTPRARTPRDTRGRCAKSAFAAHCAPDRNYDDRGPRSTCACGECCAELVVVPLSASLLSPGSNLPNRNVAASRADAAASTNLRGCAESISETGRVIWCGFDRRDRGGESRTRTGKAPTREERGG